MNYKFLIALILVNCVLTVFNQPINQQQFNQRFANNLREYGLMTNQFSLLNTLNRPPPPPQPQPIPFMNAGNTLVAIPVGNQVGAPNLAPLPVSGNFPGMVAVPVSGGNFPGAIAWNSANPQAGNFAAFSGSPAIGYAPAINGLIPELSALPGMTAMSGLGNVGFNALPTGGSYDDRKNLRNNFVNRMASINKKQNNNN